MVTNDKKPQVWRSVRAKLPLSYLVLRPERDVKKASLRNCNFAIVSSELRFYALRSNERINWHYKGMDDESRETYKNIKEVGGVVIKEVAKLLRGVTVLATLVSGEIKWYRVKCFTRFLLLKIRIGKAIQNKVFFIEMLTCISIHFFMFKRNKVRYSFQMEIRKFRASGQMFSSLNLWDAIWS